VQLRRSLCTNVTEEEWCAAGIGLRRAIWRRSRVMRCVDFNGFVVGISRSPGILRGSPNTSSAIDACKVCFKGCADAEENQKKRLCPLLVCVTHDGCLLRPVEAFHESVDCGMVGGCPGKLSYTHSGQGMEQL
jgi:hypothetical protein